MSMEDDTDSTEVELRELVSQTLEENGLLAKIRAQLRAGLYLALENEINTSEDQTTYNTTLKSKLSIPDVGIVFCLVREFLEYFDLSYTCSVFEKETFLGSAYIYNNREKLIQDLDIGIDALQNAPLLVEVLNIARTSFNLSRDLHDTNLNNTLNAEGGKFVNNTTYDKKYDSDDGSFKNESLSTSEISQQIIEVKTMPKQCLNGFNETEQCLESKQSSILHENNQQVKMESNDEVDTPEVIVLNSKHEDVENKFETDDTYEGTSSIAEDSVVSNNKEQSMLIDFDKSVKLSAAVTNSAKNLIDDAVRSPKHSFSPENPDKRKLDKSDRIEKLKPMSSLTSLIDLPPITMTKTRNSDTVLLPSLYSKDFREKSKDIDKLLDFDSLDNYEEDFMSSGSVDSVNNSFMSKKSNIDVTAGNKTKDVINQDGDKVFDSKQNDDEISKRDSENDKESSISEDIELNSSVDDLLKSGSTI